MGALALFADPPCDIPSGCCSFTGPWTVTRSSLRMLRRVAAFCRPLRPVLLASTRGKGLHGGPTGGRTCMTHGGGGGGGSKTSQTTPGNNQHSPQYSNYWALLTRKRHIPPHSAQPRHTNDWAPQTRKRHQRALLHCGGGGDVRGLQSCRPPPPRPKATGSGTHPAGPSL